MFNMGETVARGSIFSNRIDITKPSEHGGSLSQREGLTPERSKLDVYESSTVDRSNGDIVVRLTGVDSRQFGMSEPVVLYERKP